MQSLNNVPIEFETNGMKIMATNATEKYGNRNFLIFETNYPNFFIKMYRSKNEEFNVLMKKSNIESVKMLLSKNCFPVKILNETQNAEHKIWALLIESYVLNFKEIIENSCQSHEFDILKFFMQIGQYLQVCSTLDIGLIQLNDDNVVMDRDGNFQLANINNNVQLIREEPQGKVYIQERIKYIMNQKSGNSLAPEVVFEQNVGIQSMIWDLGVLAHIAFTGKEPKIIYDSQKVCTDLDLSGKISTSQKLIIDLIDSCLKVNPGQRIGIDDLLDRARSGLNEINLFLVTINNSILRDVIREDNREIQTIIEGLGDLVSNDSIRRDDALNDCTFESVIYNNKDMSIKKMIRTLLSPSELIYDTMMKNLVKQAWDTPITIVKVYNFLKSKIDEIVQNEIRTMKMLLLLHTFIFKGSQNTLIVFLKDGTDQNSVNLILEIILRAFSNRRQSLIFRYAYFIYIKFNLHLKLIKVLQNNFSVSRSDLIYQFEKLLTPEVFLDLFNFLKFAYSLLLSLRKFSFDYFYKNFIVSFYKELIALLGLLSNMTIFLLFGAIVLENENGAISDKESKIILKLLDEFLEVFDFMAMSMNIYVEQVRRLKFENFGFFKIKKNLPEAFEMIRMKIKNAVKSGEEMDSSYFTNNFLNSMLRMSETIGFDQFNPKSMKEIEGLDTKKNFRRIIPKFVEAEPRFRELILSIGKLVPKSRTWYEQNVKLMTKGMNDVPNNMGTNIIQSSVMNNRMNKLHAKPKTISTQTEPFKRSSHKKERTIEEIERDKMKVNQKMKIASKGVSGENDNMNGKGEDIIINGLNVNHFILDEFKRSLDAWIIDYEELKLDELIASGSTCKVYKGTYKNMKVAIKQLLTPGDEKRVKFMKEFKRELSLLISLPHHPNLLTLIGFCIKGNHIYLVTEFCEGGTLFDILYRKHLDVKVSFKQKVKLLLDVARGMQFLHQLKRQIIHRDLKSLNILIDKKITDDSLDFQAKIADFGLARSFDNPEDFVTKRMGTFHWMAPEIFSDKPYTTKTDIYAFAIIVWEIFAERTPYYHLDSPTKIIKYVYYDNGRPFIDDCKFEERFKKDMVELIKKNWDKNSSHRQEFFEIYDILKRVLQNV